MMRRSTVGATFVVACAGAAGAGALDNNYVYGAAGLSGVMRDVLGSCPAADPAPGDPAIGLKFLRAESVLAETYMQFGSQAVTPMNRFLPAQGVTAGDGACWIEGSANPTGSKGTASSVEGLVFGLSSAVVVASKSSGGSVTCNGSDNGSCFGVTAGLADATSPIVDGLTDAVRYPGGTYQFDGWRDVLRIILAGLEHGDFSPTARRCGGELRRKLADNYGLLFRGATCKPNPSEAGTVNCTQLHHAFVPDNESAATDVLVSLLSLPRIELPSDGAVHPSRSPWCNALNDSQSIGAANVPLFHADYQDFDPIRRDCLTSEEVCSRIPNNASGTASRWGLGLTLTIVSADFVADSEPLSHAFPTQACTSFALTPLVPANLNVPALKRCPNGDKPAFGASCFWPVSAGGSFSCLNASSKRPAVVIDVDAQGNIAQVEGRPISAADGRVYNLFAVKDPPVPESSPTLALDRYSRQITGAFYRIHTTKSVASPVVTCQNKDATSQIGCLAAASPCSVGVASRNTVLATSSVTALRVNRMSPVFDECVQYGAYPLTSKLYLNSFAGFQSALVANQELGLARCLASRAIIDPILVANGFLPLPDGAALGSAGSVGPYCEDFNETQCGNLSNPTNVNACADNPSAIPGAASSTRCGDGVRQFGEGCDDGNNISGDGCSPFCVAE